MTDPISDYLTRIRNAQQAGHRLVEIPASKIKKRITEILYEHGYILKYKFEDTADNQGVIKIALKYDAATKTPVKEFRKNLYSGIAPIPRKNRVASRIKRIRYRYCVYL